MEGKAGFIAIEVDRLGFIGGDYGSVQLSRNRL